MKKNWMAKLAAYYDQTREKYPDDRLMILFDIDGTILDMRYMVHRVLQDYDKEHGTQFFSRIQIEDIRVHENQIDMLLPGLNVPLEMHPQIVAWFNEHRWSSEHTLHSHEPFAGVMEIIRWFQLQPNAFVGLNTARPESVRSDTLRSLNDLGHEYKVQFTDELLFMNKADWDEDTQNSKAAGVRHFQQSGFRVFAFVENEPMHLQAVSKMETSDEILLLHADTIFESKRTGMPRHVARGKKYDLTELIPEVKLPQHVQFVWHGLNDHINLRQFLASDVAWGECDVRTDPFGSDLILRHDSFQETPLGEDEDWVNFVDVLNRMMKHGRSAKLDLKAGGQLIDQVFEVIESLGIDGSRLWFNGNVERIQEEGFRKLAKTYPGATLQCPVDFLAPLICSTPEKAKEILDMYLSWGVNRFSINWQSQDRAAFFNQMDQWNLEVNIYNIPDLEGFLQAVLLNPTSITSDFNFPKWHYYGRGAGENRRLHEYDTNKRFKR